MKILVFLRVIISLTRLFTGSNSYKITKNKELDNMKKETNKMSNKTFSWPTFYMEFADKLLVYKNKRVEILKILEEVYEELKLKNPFKENEKTLEDICPFTVMGSFNKGITNKNRIAIATKLSKRIGVSTPVPAEIEGVPLINNMQAWFFGFESIRKKDDIENLWTIFESAIKYADEQSSHNKEKFVESYNIVKKQYGVKWNITIGLYWIRPFFYLTLDKISRDYLLNEISNYNDVTEISSLKSLPDANTYLKLLNYFKSKFSNKDSLIQSYPELSSSAFKFITTKDGDDKDENEDEDDEPNLESYTEMNFLNEVFMDGNSYQRLTKILKMKKNLIIQGAPGVGKTFSAKRLAYAMMGGKDESRIQMVQFHQSYSYEDFVMGYRPTETGFELATGPFYEFCKRAEQDSNQDYFFIIDEINRGNLSQIFGELLMLIENDKRGQSLRLIYKDEVFSIPKNIYIIGMMNTADRSLAIIDYALRRRFSFYNLVPAFESAGFKEIIQQVNNNKFTELVNQIKRLNEDISKDETLGAGFEIGHSYLCPKEDVTDEWLSIIIEYELLPLLEEYWFDEPERVEQWKNNLFGVLNDKY